jgi:Iap family predicted aminopeptidase
MAKKKALRFGISLASGIALGGAALAWTLRRWQPIRDSACARLTEPVSGDGELVDLIVAANLQRDTEELATIRPRNAGTPGEARAREWVAGRFQDLGLASVRMEPVLYPRWMGGDARLTLLTWPPEELACLVLSGSAATKDEGLVAPLLDVGTGQPEVYADLTPERTRGRIHLAWGGSLHRRDICLNARRAGASGVIVAHPDPEPVGGDDSFLVEAGTSTVFGRLPTVAVSYAVGQRLRAAAEESSLVRIEIARRYRVTRAYNVVGELPGRTREYVSLVAHHDAWYAGAADNAAGVAAILAVANAAIQVASYTQPRRTLRFVSTAAEEEGLMGALGDVVLRGLAVKARCRGVISLDVVGAPGETLWATGWPAQLRGSAVAIGRGLGYEKETGSRLGIYDGTIYGDHWPYTQLRIPGLLLGKYPYRFYHTPYDTPDRLDFKDAALHATIAGMLALRMANL